MSRPTVCCTTYVVLVPMSCRRMYSRGVLIRAIEARDDAAVCALVRSSLEAAGLNIPGTAYFDPQLAHLSQYYAARADAGYWIAEDDGVLVGGAGIGPVAGAPDVCELQKLYVNAAYRGCGYGGRLLDTALVFAAHHYRRCYLETHSVLKSALALYSKRGFALMDHALAGSEHSAMNRWMIKDLKPARAAHQLD